MKVSKTNFSNIWSKLDFLESEKLVNLESEIVKNKIGLGNNTIEVVNCYCVAQIGRNILLFQILYLQFYTKCIAYLQTIRYHKSFGFN